MLIFDYPSKKVLKTCVGQPLNYEETSISGVEFSPNAKLVGCNRPHLTGHKREFFAQVVMNDGLIAKVS
jgi:hypothetical protein